MSIAETNKDAWIFVEGDPNFGEVWKVYFEVDRDDSADLHRLKELLSKVILSSGERSGYQLGRIHSIPPLTKTAAPSGSYPAEQRGELNFEKLQAAIDFIEADGEEASSDDPLFRLGLFS